jgi:CheY-like chemotaxis protein
VSTSDAAVPAAEYFSAKILVVDDNPMNVQLLERMLKRAGYLSVASTLDPNAVCGLNHRDHFDLILLDLQMPFLDGFQVMRALRETEEGSYPAILATSAEPGHRLRAMQAGAGEFVSKPFEFVNMRTRIHNMLEARLQRIS